MLMAKGRTAKLVDGAMPKATTRMFLEDFYMHGRKRRFWKGVKPNRVTTGIGKWIRGNTRLSDHELIDALNKFVYKYSAPHETRKKYVDAAKLGGAEARVYFQSEEKHPSRFRQTRSADCVAKSTVMGEMARAMGFKVDYCLCKWDEFDKALLETVGKRYVEELEFDKNGHAYLEIEGVQQDPAWGKRGTMHEGGKQTRRQRAATVWTSHAHTLFDTLRPIDGLKAIDLALPLDREEALSRLEHYVNKYASKHGDEIIRHYTKVLKAKPKNVAALLGVGTVLLTGQKYAQAEKYYDKLLQIIPRDKRIIHGKARCCEAQGNDDDAAKYYKELFDLDPTARNVLEKRLLALQKLGKTGQARQELEKAVKRFKGGHPNPFFDEMVADWRNRLKG